MEYDTWQRVRGRSFQVRIQHWYIDEGPEAGEHWYILLEDRHLTPTNYEELNPQAQAFIRSLHPRKIVFREDPESGMTRRITIGDLPKEQRILHGAWPGSVGGEGHKGSLEKSDIDSIISWLDEHDSGELKGKVRRKIGRMQKRFARFRRRKGF